MRNRLILFFLFVLVFAAPALLAQDDAPTEINWAVVEIIIATGVGGVGVKAITELVKRGLVKVFKVTADGMKKVLSYVACAVTSAGATVAYLTSISGFTWTAFIGYTLAVFALASGLYKSQPKPA